MKPTILFGQLPRTKTSDRFEPRAVNNQFVRSIDRPTSRHRRYAPIVKPIPPGRNSEKDEGSALFF